MRAGRCRAKHINIQTEKKAQPGFSDEYSYDGTAYSYNPCFSMSLGGTCKKAAVCMRNPDNTYADLGRQDTAVWTYTGYYPQVTYTAASGRSVVHCKMDLSHFENEEKVKSMNMWTNCACPNTCERVDPIGAGSTALTAGSVLLIIFFSASFVYIVVGVIYNYNKNKATGKEMLPNYSFWAALPGLVKAVAHLHIASILFQLPGIIFHLSSIVQLNVFLLQRLNILFHLVNISSIPSPSSSFGESIPLFRLATILFQLVTLIFQSISSSTSPESSLS
ncbi:cation-dependent mannose-6-phosphate receptor [Plakobranchus ocellatus]|uniref:Cation-dependent mannose-6-phosphate receptor n=1 Tax=Plakobranchus ocellatus TaxID=259542 RepID=A0AAV4B6H3_9GAST|nr:cation-dependent mannose-6-phosphate receptor [Plakobranchus ocellatus]